MIKMLCGMFPWKSMKFSHRSALIAIAPQQQGFGDGCDRACSVCACFDRFFDHIIHLNVGIKTVYFIKEGPTRTKRKRSASRVRTIVDGRLEISALLKRAKALEDRG
ncbi:hypothetical protein KIN20_005490 [Parelaphostrongylus tenuis]|uniref:Uncharacterized protein n=1 Tax=Parelaphostrongylus tenuis TaxID=148309 RepID=A0AAD5MIZ0_PARTN|nr:hypothetical protein KIN20_005490 [Parelaphostrongylus tenuis]